MTGDDMGRALEAAVVRGDIPLASWLIDRGTNWPEHARLHRPAHKAAIKGRLDVLKWLEQEAQLDGVVGLVVKAAEHGHFDVVTWLVERDAQSGGHITHLGAEGSLAIHGAVVNGHLKVTKYLRARITTPTNSMQRARQAAEQRRQLPILSAQIGRFEQAQAVSSKIMVLAAMRGYLDGVQWLYTEYGSDPDVALFADDNKKYGQLSAMDEAASNDHLNKKFKCKMLKKWSEEIKTQRSHEVPKE
ncbi:hypothetical protein PF006_g23281 [Phytophthora fragariae]|uniref:Ankyrin repeat-containing protein n=1 Tax=Phytophthora fragariae TaxID=53985 RepID=A0A6A3RR12_9STRA|nr:hypothetical protein PF006_g23281 [Phytophthora fragariae]